MVDLPPLPKLYVPVFRDRRVISEDPKQKKKPGDKKEPKREAEKSLPTHKPEKKYLCKYYVKNACIRGNNCTFSHDLTKFPCKLFHLKKNCRRRNCQFSHAPISSEEIKLLISDGWEVEKEAKEETYISPFTTGS